MADLKVKRIEITKEQIERAEQLFQFNKLKNSITEGDGNLAGALGEIIVCDEYKGEQANTYDYDLIINGFKIDVKTKRISNNLSPKKTWNATVPNFNTTQKCDYYCFVNLRNNFEVGFINGFITKEDFYEKASFREKGEIDPSGNGVWRFKADCYNLSIVNLKM